MVMDMIVGEVRLPSLKRKIGVMAVDRKVLRYGGE
jgi:hypothetical protein